VRVQKGARHWARWPSGRAAGTRCTLGASGRTSCLRVQRARAREDELGVAPSHEDAELLAHEPEERVARLQPCRGA
jgi:hypothetical protein